MSSVFKRRNASEMQEKLKSLTGGQQFESDENEWKLQTDKAGNGSAIIRFLPSKDDDSTPFVKIFNHGFKIGTKWFIENCPTTIGLPCPVCDLNSELWNSGPESNKKIARDRKRKLSYWGNIKVNKDPSNPENNDKVFKFRFGSKIMDKVNEMANPSEELDEAPIDVTCVYEGCDFTLKSLKKDNFLNYDSSQFKQPSQIPGIEDENVAKKLLESMHDLNPIVAANQFKSYEELKEKLAQVLNTGPTSNSGVEKQLSEFDKDLQSFGEHGVTSDDHMDKLLNTPESSGDDDLDDMLKDL